MVDDVNLSTSFVEIDDFIKQVRFPAMVDGVKLSTSFVENRRFHQTGADFRLWLMALN